MARKRRGSSSGFLSGRAFLVVGIGALVAIVAVGAFYALNGDDAPKRELHTDPVVTNERQADVIVDNLDYTPRDLTVPVGATVTWKFEDDLPHNVIDDRGAFDSGILQKGDEWSRTFDVPGTFYYYCTLHHIMQGTLTVAEQ